MMNAHVVAYYWFMFDCIDIKKPSDAWASMFAMSRYFNEKTLGAAA